MQINARESDGVAHLKRIVHLSHGRIPESIPIFVGFPHLLAKRCERYWMLAVHWIVISALGLNSVSPPFGWLPGSRNVMHRSRSGLALRCFRYGPAPTIHMLF